MYCRLRSGRVRTSISLNLGFAAFFAIIFSASLAGTDIVMILFVINIKKPH